jgi:hypothetical protein
MVHAFLNEVIKLFLYSGQHKSVCSIDLKLEYYKKEKSFIKSNAVFFLVLETGVWCYFPQNKSVTSTFAMVTEVKDSFCGKILSLLPFNIGTTNFCSRDESSLQQATE